MIRALIYKDYKLFTNDQLPIILFQYFFILVISGVNLGIYAYLVIAITGAWSFLMGTVEKEKLGNGKQLLYAISYTKEQLVLSHYLGVFLQFFIITGLYFVFSSVMTFLNVSYFPSLTKEFFFGAAIAYLYFVAITMPLYYLLPQIAVRLLSIALIFIPAYSARFFIVSVGRKEALTILERIWSSGIYGIAIIAVLLLIVSERFVVAMEKRQEG